MKHTFAGKSAALSRLPVYAVTCVPHMRLCTTHTYARRAPERQTFSSLAEEMWNQVTIAHSGLFALLHCWETFGVVLGCQTSRGNAGKPTMGPIALLRSNNRKKVTVKSTLQLFVWSQMSCWLSKKHVFKPKLLPSNMTFTHSLWLGSTTDVSCGFAKPPVVVTLFCFFAVFVFIHESLPKDSKLDLCSKEVFTAQQVHDCAEQQSACLQQTRDGSISVCQCAGARVATNEKP